MNLLCHLILASRVFNIADQCTHVAVQTICQSLDLDLHEAFPRINKSTNTCLRSLQVSHIPYHSSLLHLFIPFIQNFMKSAFALICSRRHMFVSQSPVLFTACWQISLPP